MYRITSAHAFPPPRVLRTIHVAFTHFYTTRRQNNAVDKQSISNCTSAILTHVQPKLSLSNPTVRVAGAIVLAIGVVIILNYGVLYIWQTYAPEGFGMWQTPSEREKLNILARLAGTTSLSETEKLQMLEKMAGETQVSEEEKIHILQSLQ